MKLELRVVNAIADPLQYVEDYCMEYNHEKALEQINRIKADKEKLREALNKVGYDIPYGLQLGDWAEIINEKEKMNE